ncbi:MAG: hypothetical protein ACQKBW_00750 [Puniceicoccales bacterium]
MNKIASKLTFLSILGIAAASHATVMFSETFEEYDLGAIPQGGAEDKWTFREAGGTFIAVDDTTHIFSQDANQYGRMNFDGAAGAQDPLLTTRATEYSFSGGSSTGQVSFQFVDTSAIAETNYGFLLRLGTSAGNSGTALAFYIRNGELRYSNNQGNLGAAFASYSLDTVNQIDIVYNYTASDLDYSGSTVAATSMDIYINGELVGDNITTADSTVTVGSAVSNFNLTAKTWSSEFEGELLLDDIIVDSEISIPEPSSSCAILGVAAALVLFLSRRRFRS